MTFDEAVVIWLMKNVSSENPKPLPDSVEFEVDYDYDDGLEFNVSWTEQVEIKGPKYRFSDGTRFQPVYKRNRTRTHRLGGQSYDINGLFIEILEIATEASATTQGPETT